MSEKRRRFSEEFKREAVRLAFEGSRPVAEVAREVDVRPDMLRRWRRKLSGAGTAPSEAEREMTRLRRELRDVREERDILKKSLGDLLGPTRLRYEAVERLQGQYPMRRLCRTLGVHRSGYQRWLQRGQTRRAREDRRLRQSILEVHAQARGCYGAPRIERALRRRSVRTIRRRVARLHRSWC